MKKIMMLIFTLICLFSVKNVFAQNQYQLTLEKQDGIYFSRRGSDFNDDSHPYYLYRFGNIYAYCIQPGKNFKTYTYLGLDNYIDLPVSEEVMKKLELIGYYGRDYPGHDNIRYSMAAQALIWELTGVDKVTFWTKQYEQGEEIDVTKEKNEIYRLIEKHNTVPNLPKTINADLQKELVLEDTNYVLENYEIIDSGGNNVSLNGNVLRIIPQKVGDSIVSLKLKRYDNLKTLIFVGKDNSDSQILGRLRFSEEKTFEIKIKTNGIKLEVTKVDENNNKVKIEGIRFKIKNLNNSTYICENEKCEYVTNKDGVFKTQYLDFGEYQIEEIENQVIPGYTWNSEKINVLIHPSANYRWKNDANYLEVNFKNNHVKSIITIYKKGEKVIFHDNKIIYEEIMLPNFEFDLYNVKDEFIKRVKTDETGKAVIYNGPVGSLYLLERTRLDNYVIEEDKKTFDVNQVNQYASEASAILTYYNYLKKGTLEFKKIDSKTNMGIENTVIEIYNESDELLLTRKTDDDGMIIINDLPFGKYYIKEKEANPRYQKSNEIIFFEIKEHKEVVKVTMTNDLATGNLEIHKYGEELVIKDNEIKYEQKPLDNIEFMLYSDDNTLIAPLVTDSNGYAKQELELGKYYIKEKNILTSYQKNDEQYSFEIKKDGEEVIGVHLEINNYLKKGNVVIMKEDYYTGIGIPNTIIEIYNEKDELLLTKKTDMNGKINIENLPLGKYYIVEKEANYFYQKNNQKKYFEIKENEEIVKVKLANKKIVGNLEIIKRGEQYKINNNEINYEKICLANIEFLLFNEKDELVNVIKTNKEGYAKYDNLPLGKYYLIEKTRLNNYIINNDRITFEIIKDDNMGVDVKLEIDNYLKKGTLEFTKEDLKTHDGISNTIIELYDEKNNLLLTKETDEMGKIIVENLPIGKYYIVEKEANSLYQLTNEKVSFEIKEDKDIVNATMTNEKISVKVPKTATNEGIVVHSLFALVLLFGFGRFYYERKETT